MCKRIFVYLMAFYIAFIPVQRANAVIPIVMGAVYAIELAAPHAIRYLASEIAISAVVKAFQASNAYYSASAKISNVKFLKYFKSKTALGIAAFVGVVDAIGYYMTNDGVVMKEGSIEIPAGDVAPVAGIAWCIRGSRCASTITDAAWIVVTGMDHIKEIKINPPTGGNEGREDLRSVDYLLSNGSKWAGSGDTAQRMPCEYVKGVVDSCQEGYTPPNGQPTVVDDAILSASLLSHISTLDEEKQRELFADSSGVIDADLVKDFDAENGPPMPDGETPIPDIGNESWTNAHLIASGKAQSSDSSKPDYVSSSDWDEAYYLANTVANSNDYITGLNSGAITIPDTGTGTGTGDNTGGNTGAGDISVTVDVAGVESRLDTNNELTQDLLEYITQASTTTVDLQSVPDSSFSASFWDVKYPDGISGVVSKFIDDMKQTPVFEWLSGFVLDLGAGSIPAFELCFNVIAGIDFGCYTLQADAYIWSGIKACMILFSLIVSRRIVFGG